MQSDSSAQNASAAVHSGHGKYRFYRKLFFLYFLNIIDWICTEALLQSGRFVEMNPIMKPVIGGFWNTVLIKGVVPLALVILCAVIYRLAGSPEGKFVNAMLSFGIFVYSAIILWHIFNFVLLFFVF